MIHNPTMRVLKIFDAVSAHDGLLNMSGICKLTSIPPSTIQPILQTLCSAQYVTLDKERGTYSIGLRFFLSSASFVQSSGHYKSIKSVIQDMATRSGETCHYCTLDGGNVLYVIKIDSLQPVRMYSAIGRKLPAYGTAIGKALISELSMDEIKALYPQGIVPLTENTIKDFDSLYKQLLEIRETGFAYECEESNLGVRCIARPIKREGKIISAVSIGIPVFRYTKEKKEQFEAMLTNAANEIEKLVSCLPVM
jgi:DNA-binding IclR family transcriptional regulator